MSEPLSPDRLAEISRLVDNGAAILRHGPERTIPAELLAECRHLSSQVGELNRQRDFEWDRRKTAETEAARLSSECEDLRAEVLRLSQLVPDPTAGEMFDVIEQFLKHMTAEDALRYALVWLDGEHKSRHPSPEGTE